MIPLSVAQVAALTGAALADVPDPGATVTGPVVIDSREAQPGALFAALPGTRADGHDFAAAAAAAGAVAVLATRPVGVPALIVADVPAALATLARAVVDRLPELTIVGITGSAGKTTTKDLIAQLLEQLGPTVSPPGSFNNEIGHPLTALRVTGQTRYLVSEMSARGIGHIAELCRITPPLLGAVLCVGHAHLGEFGSLDQVAVAKGELPAALPAGGVAVLNADDERVAAMAARTSARVVTFGQSAGADVRAEQVRSDELGRAGFLLVTRSGSAPVQLRLHGEHHVTNALAAATLAAELGMETGAIAAGLSAAVARSRWRMEVTALPDGVTILNDAYNANPDAVQAAIATLATMARAGRGIAVLGHMTELGDEADELHEAAGAQAARAGVAALIVVGDEAAPMLAGAKSVPSWSGDLVHVPDVGTAVAAVRSRIRPGDVVLVKASHSIGLERVALALTGERPLPDSGALPGREGAAR
ncbi:MAG TPA: UDP-N-acetylmuramoyl-tripeptide--D-alanyl-D-alanine ligase [Streptosporangiaceae bacterium]|nr:UDP-N-acetylmuramoyl-tripeptide--D-alanyl-D-alanine ligase [Streptosporangiaceae bacterium]